MDIDFNTYSRDWTEHFISFHLLYLPTFSYLVQVSIDIDIGICCIHLPTLLIYTNLTLEKIQLTQDILSKKPKPCRKLSNAMQSYAMQR